MKKNQNKILFAIVCFLFLNILFFLFSRNYKKPKKENFITVGENNIYPNYIDFYNKAYNDPSFSHTVDMPIISNTYTCKNMCSSQSKCYITGQQCTSDTDCYGCKIPVPSYKEYNNIPVRPQNDAGKYSYLTPQYSSLTTDMGTMAKLYNKDKLTPVPTNPIPFQYADAVNFKSKTNKDNSSFIWNPKIRDYVLNYPLRLSHTGLFIQQGPLSSNSYL